MFYPTPTPTPTTTETPTPTETPTETPTIDPNLKQVKIHIINSSAFKDNGTADVIAEALDVMEDSGKCTLVVSQGTVSETVTVDAEPNVSTMQCFPMSVPLAKFKDGKLEFTVTYLSTTAGGISTLGTIPIQ
jgi:hypothetical protein